MKIVGEKNELRLFLILSLHLCVFKDHIVVICECWRGDAVSKTNKAGCTFAKNDNYIICAKLWTKTCQTALKTFVTNSLRGKDDKLSSTECEWCCGGLNPDAPKHLQLLTSWLAPDNIITLTMTHTHTHTHFKFSFSYVTPNISHSEK